MATPSSKKSKKPQAQQTDVLSRGQDVSLSVYSFFETAHKELHRLRKAWRQGCRKSSGTMLALVKPTLLTSDALGRLQDMKGELVSACETTGRPYYNMIKVLYGQDAITASGKRYERFSADDEFSLLPIGETLERLKVLGPMYDKFGWPEPILPMRLYYSAMPELLASPKFPQFVEGDEFLSQVILDMQLASVIEEESERNPRSSGERYILPQDCFTKALLPVFKHEYVTVTAVITAKLVLDLREILPTSGLATLPTLNSPEQDPGRPETSQKTLGTEVKGKWSLATDLRDLTFVKTKKQVLADTSSYPWLPPNKRPARERARAVFQSGAVPQSMVVQFLDFFEAKFGGMTNDAQALQALDLRLVQAHRDELFLVNVNPAMAGHFTLRAGLSTDKKHRARRGKFMQLQPTQLAAMAGDLSQGRIDIPTLLRNVCTTNVQEQNVATKAPKGNQARKRGKARS